MLMPNLTATTDPKHLKPEKQPAARSAARWAAATLLVSALSGCGLWSGLGGSAGPAAPVRNVHLVVDAGSSGTRLCPFVVQAAASGACSIAKGEAESPCVDVPARAGLAELEPAEVGDALTRGLAELPPAVRARVGAAALLGTGGFRRHNEAEQARIIHAAHDWFERMNIPANAQVITGEEEGRLAWYTMRELTGSQRHAIIDTEGAAVQVAAGEGRQVQSVSAPVGMNDTFRKLQDDPAFPACANATGTAKGLDADRCAALIADKVYSASAVASPGFPIPDTVFGFGTPWVTVFDKYLKRGEVSVSELREAARKVCTQSAAEVQAGTGESPEFARRACYLMAYHVAQIEAVPGVRLVRRGGESWPRGAAVNARYFPTACKE